MSRDEVVRMRKGHSPGGHLGMLQAEGAPRARALGWKAQSRGCSRRDLGGDWKGMGCKPLDQGCCRVSPPPPPPRKGKACAIFLRCPFLWNANSSQPCVSTGISIFVPKVLVCLLGGGHFGAEGTWYVGRRWWAGGGRGVLA